MVKLQPKVRATGVIDSFELAVLKTVGERVMVPIIGNGTVQSGLVKLVGAGVLGSVSRNKHIGLASSAMIVDGFEDVVKALLPQAGGADSGGW